MWEPDHYLLQLQKEIQPCFEYQPGIDWKEWRARLTDRFVSRLGGFPDLPAELEPTVLERAVCDGYIRERVEISTFAGMRMPMYLMINGHVGFGQPLFGDI